MGSVSIRCSPPNGPFPPERPTPASQEPSLLRGPIQRLGTEGLEAIETSTNRALPLGPFVFQPPLTGRPNDLLKLVPFRVAAELLPIREPRQHVFVPAIS
jgi:hypothetical protein